MRDHLDRVRLSHFVGSAVQRMIAANGSSLSNGQILRNCSDNFGQFVLAINRGQQDIHHGTSKAAPKVGGKAPDFDSLPLGTAYPLTGNDID